MHFCPTRRSSNRAEVAAVVDAREHDVGRTVSEDLVMRDQHAVGRRAVDREALGSEPALAQRAAQRQRVAGGRLLRSEEHTSELQSLMRLSYAVFCSKKQN